MKNLAMLLVAATTVCALSNASASIEKKSYQLKGDAPTGTRLLSVDAISPLPFNKNYLALSETQKELVRSKYDSLNANDTPPFPARGLKSIYRPVISANQSLGKVGLLKLEAMVDENGRVGRVTVTETPSKALSKRAIRSLRNTRFDAATCDGSPCAMTFPMEIKFQ